MRPSPNTALPARRLGLVLGSWLTVGCAPDDEFPLPDVVWEGTAVHVRMQDPRLEVCGGSFEALDRHAELVRNALQLEGDGVVQYSIGDEDFVDEACVPLEDPLACADPTTGRVFTSSPFNQHEIVHAVRFLDPQLTVRSPAIEEGLATLFGADNLGNQIHPLDAAGILADPRVGGHEEYFRAGHTMALLLERHGTESFRLFDTSSTSMDEDLAFAEVFGESKEDFASTIENETLCEQSQWWIPLLECDGDPVIADPATDQLVLRGDLSCSADDVKGPRSGRIWVSRHFRLDRRTSELDYRFDMPNDSTLEIVSCGGGCPDRFAYVGDRDSVGSISNGLPSLDPGEYFLRVFRPLADEGGGFEIVLH